jgi:cobalt-zinc-cadmium efflux system membrane fusion protein
LVLTSLAALAFFGHQTDWRIPKFAELVGDERNEVRDWCAVHSVPESACVECNERLLPRAPYQWCAKHGVHDCLYENPHLAQLPSPPVITRADLERAQRALELKERPENNKKCKKIHRRIQFASQEVIDKMGIDITPAWEDAIIESVSAAGEIAFEQPRVAPVSTPVAGRVWYVTEKARIGTVVKRGDMLALVDAAEIGRAKVEFQQAFAQLELRTKSVDNLKAAVEQGAIPQARFLEIETAQREAQIRLRGAQQALINLGLPIQIEDILGMSPDALGRYLQFFGIPETWSKRLDAKTTSANLFPLLAPRDGTVTSASTVAGEVVDPSKILFFVSDTSQMWLNLNVRSEDVPYLRVRDPLTGKSGQVVKFRPDGGKEEVSGELIWKSSHVDEKTRTVQFRAELPNPRGVLLANTFGLGHVILREEKNAVVVPNEGLHWEGDCNIVFVRDKRFMEPGAPKVFHVRTVRPGVRTASYTEIIAGLLPGEVVATKNSANLRGELLKNNLGAG